LNYLWIVIGVIVVAMALSVVRLLKGPSTSDRVVALDVLSTQGSALLIVLALQHGSSLLLDVSLVFALVGFVGVIVYARHLEGRF
jgi:multicomponent Na+:H+ antiporter subunit F